MDFDVPLARGLFHGTICVPPSKSIHQRALVLSALAETAPRLLVPGTPPGQAPEVGDDVRHLTHAMDQVGGWSGDAWGASRASLTLDAGEGGTGFRFLMALATLRPRGARTRITGRPVLCQRPHEPLGQALRSLGGHVRRRRSGSRRVVGGGMRLAPVHLDAGISSQFASALLLIAPRIGGLHLGLRGRVVSRPYLDLTVNMLRRFGIDVEVAEDDRGLRYVVSPGVPRADTIEMDADASAAAGLVAAAALTGGRVEIPGLRMDATQADLALLPVLERMGARVASTADGVAVEGPAASAGENTPRLQAAGDIDLTDATDLLPVVAALAAVAEGQTRIHGASHARRKESDRVATSVAAIRALGGTVAVDAADTLTIDGGPLQGGVVQVAGDHRIAFGFGVLGLVVPGVRLRDAEVVTKSHPDFLTQVSRIADGS